MLKLRGKIWYAVIHLGGNRYEWRSTGLESEAAARDIHDEHVADIKRKRCQARIAKLLGREEPKKAVSSPLQDVWEKYKKINPEPTRFQKMVWNVFEDWAKKHGVKTTADATPQKVLEFLASYNSAKSFNTYRAGLHSIFKKVELHGIKNPVETIPTRSVSKAPSVKYSAFSIEEMEALLNAAGKDSPWRIAILVAVYTGLRKTDVFHLRWNQIRKDAIDLIPGKTSKHGRAVYIPLHTELKDLIGPRPENAKDTDYVFPKLAEKYNSGTFQRSFDDLLVAEGITDTDKGDASFHSLRATFITIAESIGIGVLGGIRHKLVDEKAQRNRLVS